MRTNEKILAEALELREKGVSLGSIVSTYPEHKDEIEELFAAMSVISLEKEKIKVPKDGLERLLAALPEVQAPVVAQAPQAVPAASPFAAFMASMQSSSLKFVLPIAALAILTGSLVLHKGAPSPAAETSIPVEKTAGTVPSATSTTTGQTTPQTLAPTAAVAPGGMAPRSMIMLPPNASTADILAASLSQEAAQEAAIAEGNDNDTATALAADRAIATDPTRSYEN